jgi:hypothetical protein
MQPCWAKVNLYMSAQVFLLHENPEWVEPLEAQLRSLGLPSQSWDLTGGVVSLDEVPPEGVFYCRMSASAHTRGHNHAGAYAAALLSWLESAGRRVVNGSSALTLELSKVQQYAALRAAGVPVPRTRVAVGSGAIVTAAQGLRWPIIVKPNRGGKGLGVVRVEDAAALRRYIDDPQFDAGPDGVVLVQEYIEPRTPSIVRNEFVGGRHLYSVRVDTSSGFELCPADVCAIDDLACPVGEGAQAGDATSSTDDALSDRFQIMAGFSHPLITKYETLLETHGIEIAGIEMIEDCNGQWLAYDINVNTNYNSAAESASQTVDDDAGGMVSVARFLGELLDQQYKTRARDISAAS